MYLVMIGEEQQGLLESCFFRNKLREEVKAGRPGQTVARRRAGHGAKKIHEMIVP